MPDTPLVYELPKDEPRRSMQVARWESYVCNFLAFCLHENQFPLCTCEAKDEPHKTQVREAATVLYREILGLSCEAEVRRIAEARERRSTMLTV